MKINAICFEGGGYISREHGKIVPFWKEESITESGGVICGDSSNLWYRQEKEFETIEINSRHVVEIRYEKEQQND